MLRTAAFAVALSVTGANAADLTPCFTPGEDCTALIIKQIDGTKRELLVQAYGFTSAPIISAIVAAKGRGVDVRVILDKINRQTRYTGATFLTNHGIVPLIDDTVSIAHNKVMVIDGSTVITGSFNFTAAAQHKNAENVLIVANDPSVAVDYAANWADRAAVSHPYSPPNAR